VLHVRTGLLWKCCSQKKKPNRSAMVQRDLLYLHLCGSEECHAALGELVIIELEEQQEKTIGPEKLKVIINSLKKTYLKAPFNRCCCCT
jgi:hypothetical protein